MCLVPGTLYIYANLGSRKEENVKVQKETKGRRFHCINGKAAARNVVRGHWQAGRHLGAVCLGCVNSYNHQEAPTLLHMDLMEKLSESGAKETDERGRQNKHSRQGAWRPSALPSQI
jgi:hypothetical protein